MFSSIHLSSISSCSGVKPTAPRTPKPPALDTATTTSRQWVKAKIGNSMPRSSQMGVRMRLSFRDSGVGGNGRFVRDDEAVQRADGALVGHGGGVDAVDHLQPEEQAD